MISNYHLTSMLNYSRVPRETLYSYLKRATFYTTTLAYRFDFIVLIDAMILEFLVLCRRRRFAWDAKDSGLYLKMGFR